MDCPHCGGKVRIMMKIVVSFPGEMMGNITKRNIAKKEFRLLGAEWDKVTLICTECHRATHLDAIDGEL